MKLKYVLLKKIKKNFGISKKCCIFIINHHPTTKQPAPNMHPTYNKE